MTASLPKTERSESCSAGFTLLEVLVSLVLLSILLTALPSAMRLSERAFRVGTKLEQASAENAEMGFVERRLSEAMPLYQHTPDGLLAITFKGEPRAVRFVAPMNGPSDQSGLYLFVLTPVTDNAGGEKLALSWQPFRPNANQPKAQYQRVLMASAAGFTLSYFGAPAAGQEPKWNDSWTRRDTLPALMEISYRDPSGKNETQARRIELQLQSQQ